jgi:hypothetical protein
MWTFSLERIQIHRNSDETRIQQFYQCRKCWKCDSIVNQQGLDWRNASKSIQHVQILIIMWFEYIILGTVTRKHNQRGRSVFRELQVNDRNSERYAQE